MARTRGFKAEYQRRKQLAAERGLSLAQARGHARPGESPVSELKRQGTFTPDQTPAIEKAYRVFNRIRGGESLSKASKAERISPQTVKTYNRELGLFGKTYKVSPQPGKKPSFAGWFTGGDRAHFPVITSEGDYLTSVPFDEKYASIMGTYWNAVQQAAEGDGTALQSFAGQTIYDLDGNKYQLATDINLIYLVQQSMSDEQQLDFDRNFYQRKESRRAA